MALRKKKKKEEDQAPIPSEVEFDIPPLTVKESSSSKIPTRGLLTTDKVYAVRFQPDRPGYSYRQVDAFTEQVVETLAYWESKDHENQLELHDLDEQLRDSMEHREILQSTIEVFRVKGDPALNPDGSYMTESQVGSSNDNLISSLREETTRLRKELSLSKQDATEAWDAEKTLRDYLEKELMPFTQNQAKELEALKNRWALSHESAPDVVATEYKHSEHKKDDSEPIQDSDEEIGSNEKGIASSLGRDSLDGNVKDNQKDDAPARPLFGEGKTLKNLSDKNWEDAPSVDERKEYYPKRIAIEEPSPAPTVPVKSPESTQRRKSILLQSPEAVEVVSNNEGLDIRPEEEEKLEYERRLNPHLLASAPEVSTPEE